MSTLDQQTFRDIVNLLIPHCADPASRKSLIDSALLNCSVLHQIDWTGSARDFTMRVVRQLLTYGECEADRPATMLLLTALREQVGFNHQSQIDTLIAKIPLKTIAEVEAEWSIPEIATGKHIFISYSRGNLDIVRQITTDLLNAGINMWIDQVGLKPGTPDWEQALRDAIHDADVVLYMASPTARRSPYVRDELAIADMEQVSVYPVWVEGEQWMDCIPMGRGYVQFIDIRGSAYTNGLQQIANALAGRVVKFDTQETWATAESVKLKPVDTNTSPRNPYKGLRAFRAEDEQDFFGRDTLINELISILGTGTEPPRLLAVLGASGSGKSSVVMAGLLPRLQQGAIQGSANWLYLDPIVPETHPIESLTIALRRHLPATSQKAIREDLLDRNKRGLHTLTRELSEKPVVLYIDQFEELFTLVNEETERRQFIDLLTTAITEPHGSLIVLLSMRADFYDRPAQYQEFGTLIEENHVLVKPMSLADLYDVVQKPAQLPDVHLTFDEGLVTELVFAVREEVAALPLVQFTLDQLFEKRDGRTLTLDAYQKMGGVQGALARHAEATYSNLPSQQHQTLARALFLRLLEAGATERDTTRRRVTTSELTLPDVEDTRILQETANAFVDARLLVSDKSGDERTIEVSHEALIREWKRLGEWLYTAREGLRLNRRLTLAAAEWLESGENPGFLAHDDRLLQFEAWANATDLVLSDSERRFLESSLKARAERHNLQVGVIGFVLPLLGGWMAIIGYVNNTFRSDVFFDGHRLANFLGIGLVFGLLIAITHFVLNEMPSRLKDIIPSRVGIPAFALLALLIGTLTYFYFTWLYYQYEPAWDIMRLAGMSMVFGLILSNWLKVSAWQSIVLITVLSFASIIMVHRAFYTWDEATVVFVAPLALLVGLFAGWQSIPLSPNSRLQLPGNDIIWSFIGSILGIVWAITIWLYFLSVHTDILAGMSMTWDNVLWLFLGIFAFGLAVAHLLKRPIPITFIAITATVVFVGIYARQSWQFFDYSIAVPVPATQPAANFLYYEGEPLSPQAEQPIFHFDDAAWGYTLALPMVFTIALGFNAQQLFSQLWIWIGYSERNKPQRGGLTSFLIYTLLLTGLSSVLALFSAKQSVTWALGWSLWSFITFVFALAAFRWARWGANGLIASGISFVFGSFLFDAVNMRYQISRGVVPALLRSFPIDLPLTDWTPVLSVLSFWALWSIGIGIFTWVALRRRSWAGRGLVIMLIAWFAVALFSPIQGSMTVFAITNMALLAYVLLSNYERMEIGRFRVPKLFKNDEITKPKFL